MGLVLVISPNRKEIMSKTYKVDFVTEAVFNIMVEADNKKDAIKQANLELNMLPEEIEGMVFGITEVTHTEVNEVD